MRSKLPFATATLIFVVIAITFVWPADHVVVNPSSATVAWYRTLPERERFAFHIGFIAASNMWASGILYMQDREPLTLTIRALYDELSPTATMQWSVLDTALLASPPSTIVWSRIAEVSHSWRTSYPQVRNTEGGR
jgi:hypothetical protein